MAKLKPGAVSVDLETGGVYGDLDHCPREDLLESAQALLQLLPHVERHRKVWGLGKAYDSDCYIYTTGRQFAAPKVELEVSETMPDSERDFHLVVFGGGDRDIYWRNMWYEPLIGSVRDGQVVPDTEGVADLTAPARAEHEQWRREHEMQRYHEKLRNPDQLKLSL